MVIYMNLKQLLYFTALAEEGNITKAAKKLHMSQPPLSFQLKLLEEETQTLLFERGSRKIILTEAGKILYKRAKVILDMEKNTLKEIKDLKNGFSGTLSIGTVSSSGAVLLHKRMSLFHKTYPNIKFEIHEGNTFELLELLNSGVIELAIVRTPFNTADYKCTYLEKEPMAAVGNKIFLNNAGNKALLNDIENKNLLNDVGNKNLLNDMRNKALLNDIENTVSEKNTISLKDLKDVPLIIYRRFENLLSQQFKENNTAFSVFCKNDDARTSLLWANAGLGVAIVPFSAIKIFDFPNLTYKIIDDEKLYTQVCAVYHKNKFLSSAGKSFIENFKNCYD